MNLCSRIIQKMKSSKFVSLPKEWLEHNRIEVGDEVEFILRQDESLTVRKADSAASRWGVLNLGRRVVQNIRFSKCVILPKVWLDSNRIEVGDEVNFILRKDGSLTVQKADKGVPAASAPVVPEEEVSDEERAELRKIREEMKSGTVKEEGSA